MRIEKVTLMFDLQATAEANNLSAVAEAKELYLQLMDCVCGGTKPFLATATLEAEHLRCVDKALHQFQNKRKMGGEEFSQAYMERLEKVPIFYQNQQLTRFKSNECIYNCLTMCFFCLICFFFHLPIPIVHVYQSMKY